METTKQSKTFLRINFDFVDENMNVVRENLSHCNCLSAELEIPSDELSFEQQRQVKESLIEAFKVLAGFDAEKTHQTQGKTSTPLLKIFHDKNGSPVLLPYCSDAKIAYRQNSDRFYQVEGRMFLRVQDEDAYNRRVPEKS